MRTSMNEVASTMEEDSLPIDVRNRFTMTSATPVPIHRRRAKHSADDDG